ncbi:MAG: hypothetical protein WKG01_06530 [Kofleriaceae bacterium]
MLRDRNMQIGRDERTGNIGLTFPIATESFRPRHAYKALSKMGFSLLPAEEVTNYEQLRAWLLEPDDTIDFPVLEVALSFAMVGNSPEFVSGTLLRRTAPNDIVPHILFVFTAGSVCLQIDLRSDHREDHIPCSEVGAIKLRWRTGVRSTDGADSIDWEYSEPTYFNWSSTNNEPQPIESGADPELHGHAALFAASCERVGVGVAAS